MNKLEGLPTIHYISIEESKDRRNNLKNWFKEYNITNYVSHIFSRYSPEDYNIVGPYVHLLAQEGKGAITSHFSVLKEWYETTNEPYTLIVEDDLSLETVQYWNFTWKEFYSNLPKSWNCIQLLIIREYSCEDYLFESRRINDWCAGAYLIHRDYVKMLLESYYKDNIFTLEIPGLEYPPVIEHLLFSKKQGIYCFPLFVEDVNHTKSTFKDESKLINGQGEYHHESYLNSITWWKNKGKYLTIEDIINNIPFNYKNLKEKYNMNIKGIIHVGAHYGEELNDYIDSGVNNIVLFEPIKDNFSVLIEKTKCFYADIKTHQVALGSSHTKAIMYVSDNEKQSSSILKPKVHLTHHPNVYFPDMEEVEVKLLDDYKYQNCNYLHIDVQGYELEVLKGAIETLNYIDYVYCEVNQDELYEGNAYVEQIDEFLSQYNIKRVETYWVGDIWGDALYIKNT